MGVSGGADSVCLLMCLYKLSEQMDFSLEVCHINHMLRGDMADRDEKFVKNLCDKIGINFYVKRIDAVAFAMEKKLSVEEAGRVIRYSAFAKKGHLIATAHNSDDQVETALFNIIRGTGLAGLAAMKMRSERNIDGKNCTIIKPLLNISREEIEQYLKQIDQDYVTDSTNAENDYTRNKIRNKLITYIEKEINPGIRQHVLSLAQEASLANDIIDEAAKAIIEISKKEEGRITVSQNHLKNIERIVAEKVVYMCICLVANERKDISRVHVISSLDLLDGEVGAMVNLPYGIVAKKAYEEIVFEKSDKKADRADKNKILDRLNMLLDKAEHILVSDIFSQPEGEDDSLQNADRNRINIPQNEYEKYIDCGKIYSRLRWRFRESGDVISIVESKEESGDDAGKTIHDKSLNRFFIDKKIPLEERDSIPVLADGSSIVWVLGYRLGERYKVTKDTKEILKVRGEL